jgi:hypothetical protein
MAEKFRMEVESSVEGAAEKSSTELDVLDTNANARSEYGEKVETLNPNGTQELSSEFVVGEGVEVDKLMARRTRLSFCSTKKR